MTASTFAQLKSFAESTTPYIIMISGTISNGPNGGVVVGVLSSATFAQAKVAGNGGTYQITCRTPTSVTRGAAVGAGGPTNTNCTDY